MIGIIFNKADVQQATDFLKHMPISKSQNLIFVVVSEDAFQRLQKAKNKILALNDPAFTSSIRYALCGVFKDKTLLLDKCKDEWVTLLLQTLFRYFEETVEIITPMSEKIKKEGFSHPHPCSWDSSLTCAVRKNKYLSVDEKSNTVLETEYLKTQKGQFCTVTLRLDKDSVDFLKHITRAGVTVNEDGGRSQKEVFGRFTIVESKVMGNELVHTLKINKKSLVYGTEDKITTSGSLYTFHSHPENAYIMYNTKYGVPSATDYWSVYNMCKFTNAIVHFVSSLEGLYVISCNPASDLYKDWKPKAIKELIWKKLKIHTDNQITNLEEYIKMVNDLQLFKLSLLPWDQILHKNISVSFNRVDKTCLLHD